jgi:hypothetical protein
MKKKQKGLLILGGAGLLLLLLTRKGWGKTACPLSRVLNWALLVWEKCDPVARRNNVATHSLTTDCLAIIHTQSAGNPNRRYIDANGVERFGLMGVPYNWAFDLGFFEAKENLLKPETNITWGLKILEWMANEAKGHIVRERREGGIVIRSPAPEFLVGNAFIWYTKGVNLYQPVLHDTAASAEWSRLKQCYYYL